MKVLKNGKEKAFFAHCCGCGSELEYQLEDVQIDVDGNFKMRYVECPICKEKLVAQMLTAEETEQCKLTARHIAGFNGFGYNNL